MEVAFVPPVQVQLLAFLHLQRQEQEGGQVVEAPRGQVQLMDKPAVVHQEVELEAVEVDPFAGDVAPVDPPWGQAGPLPDAGGGWSAVRLRSSGWGRGCG